LKLARTPVIVVSVVLFHLVGLWALHQGLLQRMVDVVVPVMAISQADPPPPPPPPKPPEPLKPPEPPKPVPLTPPPKTVQPVLTPALPVTIPEPPAVLTAPAAAPTAPAVPAATPAPPPPAPPPAVNQPNTSSTDEIKPKEEKNKQSFPIQIDTTVNFTLAESLGNDSTKSNGTKLACVNDVILKYPTISVRMKQEGIVSLRLWFSSDGFVVKQEIVKSSGFKTLDEAAMKAYSTCQLKFNK